MKKKRWWLKIGITIGALLMLGALAGAIQVVRVAGWEDQEFFRSVVHGATVVCIVQFAGGAVLLWLAIRAFKRCPTQS